jgi:hypothetical protein
VLQFILLLLLFRATPRKLDLVAVVLHFERNVLRMMRRDERGVESETRWRTEYIRAVGVMTHDS